MVKEIILPSGFEVDKIEDGKIILKEAKVIYPKTWEDCFRKLRNIEYIDDYSNIYTLEGEDTISVDSSLHNSLPKGYGRKVLALCQLLICRNVYWDCWRPNWEDSSNKYCISQVNNIIYRGESTITSRVLAFPTRKMRDTFLQNFRDLIREAGDLI